MPGNVNLWSSPEHALDYLTKADSIPHRGEGERALVECLPSQITRVLDLGSGDGRLLALVKMVRPTAMAVALDFSAEMLDRLRARFGADPSARVVAHDLDLPLPDFGETFDAIVSSFAIHHLVHDRKRALYREVFDRLAPGGTFCNLEHVASPTDWLHRDFLSKIGYTVEGEDPSNKLLDVETQLSWMREIGFRDVDCHWKWRELALLAGTKA